MNEENTRNEAVKENHIAKETLDSKRVIAMHDEAILEILRNVIRKWRAERATEQEEWKETVVLSSSGSGTKASSFSLKKEREILPETVIISPPGTRGESEKPSRQSVSEDLKSLDETVSLQEGKKGPLSKKDIKKPRDQDFLTETVILKPSKEKDKKNDGKKE